MNRLWITSLLVFVAAVFGTVSLALISELLGDWRRRRQVAKRLKPVLEGRTRLSEVIAWAGGVTDRAFLEESTVIRRESSCCTRS